MADDAMPYEKAIEETAKAASNTVDLVREGGRAIGPAIGSIYGLLIGDTAAAARERRLDKTARKTKKILHDRDVTEQQELPEDIAIPLLEAAQGEPREELQQLWARLLANAMDPDRSRNVRPEFINLVQKLEPIDARMLVSSQEETGIERCQARGLFGGGLSPHGSDRQRRSSHRAEVHSTSWEAATSWP